MQLSYMYDAPNRLVIFLHKSHLKKSEKGVQNSLFLLERKILKALTEFCHERRYH